MTKHHYTRRELLSRLALVPAILAVPRVDLWGNPSSTDKKGYVSLFDGKSLAGWHKHERAHGTGGNWQVEKGALTGEQDPPGSGNGGILMTDKKYGDFELEIDLMPDFHIDSGVFLRVNEKGECFQIYVDYRNDGLIGFISTEERGRPYIFIRPFCFDGVFDKNGKLTGLKTKPDSREVAWKPDYLVYHCSPEEFLKTWKIGKWNTMRIRCTGKYPRITTWINNVKIMEFDGETCPRPGYNKEILAEVLGREGHIGLQVHGGKNAWKEGSKCRWKNIRIKEL